MQTLKKVMGLLAALCLSLSCLTACGEAPAGAPEGEYLETHFQIDYDRLDISVSGGEIDISAQAGADENASRLELLLGEFPGLEQFLIEALSFGEPIATGFTLVPLTADNGHFERIPTDTSGYELDSLYAGDGCFLLCTTVVAGEQNDSGSSTYTALSHGLWDAGSGQISFSRGEDFALLTVPGSVSLSSDAFAARYSRSPTEGVHGTDYSRQSGGSQFIEYAVADNAGGRRLESYTLTVTSEGPDSGQCKTFGSYYIHTWREMSAGFSLSAGPNGTLISDFAPSQPDSSWVVYAPVSIDF